MLEIQDAVCCPPAPHRPVTLTVRRDVRILKSSMHLRQVNSCSSIGDVCSYRSIQFHNLTSPALRRRAG
jgi:hypothetical protein